MTTASTPPASARGDMLFGVGGKLLYALTRIALPPLTLAHVGLAEYGLWSACFVLVGYLGMTASGFTLVYLRRVAVLHRQGDVDAIGRLLSTGIAAMALLAIVLFAGLWAVLPALLDLLRVPAEHRVLASHLWLGTAAIFLADMSLGAFANVLHAVGRIRHEQKVWLLAIALETALIVALLRAGLGVYGLLLAFGARYLFSASANAWLAWRALPGLRLGWRRFDRRRLGDFAVLGTGMQVSGLLATALHSADRVLAGVLIGPHATALIDLGGKLPTTAASLASGASQVAVSAAARHDAHRRGDALREVYRDATRITVAALALSLPFVAAFADPLARAWLGPGAASAALPPLLALLAVGTHAHVLTGPVNAIGRGRGRLHGDFAYHGLRIMALAAAVAAWLALPLTSLHQLACALVVAQVGAASTYLVTAHRHAGGRWHDLWHGVAAPTLAAYALAFALSLAWPAAAGGRADAMVQLAGAGLVWLPACALLLGTLLLTPQQRHHLRRRLGRHDLRTNA